jgi:hypothetical protein
MQDKTSVEDFLLSRRVEAFARRNQSPHRAHRMWSGPPDPGRDPDSNPKGKLYSHIFELIRAAGGRIEGSSGIKGKVTLSHRARLPGTAQLFCA